MACFCICIGTRREAHVSSHAARGMDWCAASHARAQYDHRPCSAYAVISQAFHAGRMSSRERIVISPSTSISQSIRAPTAKPPARACRLVTSFLLRVWRRTGQPHSVVRGSILLMASASALWRALCKPSPGRPREIMSRLVEGAWMR
jgi:hypothetical protein